MAEMTDAEFKAANELGRIEFETKPHASNVRYDRRTKLMTVGLYNGCSFTFPPRELQGLAEASDDEIDAVELSSVGYGLHWESLDADFTVPGLLAGRFGTDRYMQSRRARLRGIYEELLRNLPEQSFDAQAAE